MEVVVVDVLVVVGVEEVVAVLVVEVVDDVFGLQLVTIAVVDSNNKTNNEQPKSNFLTILILNSKLYN